MARFLAQNVKNTVFYDILDSKTSKYLEKWLENFKFAKC